MKKGNISIFVPHLGCPQNCSFCNQRTISGHSKAPDASDVHAAVQAAMQSPGFAKHSLQIAFFGGSFTAIDKSYQQLLLQAAAPYIKSGTVTGVRISTRPDCIEREHVLWLKQMGVTDIELGAQCLDDRVLALNDRGHTMQDVYRAVGIIKECGVNVGLQMMCGLYGSDDETDIFTAKQFIDMRPDCVRIYPTLTLKGTKLFELYQKGEYIPANLDDTVQLRAVLLEMFQRENIPVIRLGLHDDVALKEGYAAGPMHPAFGELVQSRIYYHLLQDIIKDRPAGKLVLRVNKSDVSKLTGHGGVNRRALKEKGFDLQVIPDENLPHYYIECED